MWKCDNYLLPSSFQSLEAEFSSSLPTDLVEETEALVEKFKVQEGVELSLRQNVCNADLGEGQ